MLACEQAPVGRAEKELASSEVAHFPLRPILGLESLFTGYTNAQYISSRIRWSSYIVPYQLC